MTVSLATLDPLGKPDGSATYSRAGYTVLTAVNGPIEVQRKNEMPEETSLEINIRPISGVGGPRERQLEALLGSVLRRVVLVREHPRTLVQVTCQILGLPEEDETCGASSYLPILPALLQSSILALLSACIPLSQTVVSTCAAILSRDPSASLTDSTSPDRPAVSERILDPTPPQCAIASSLHVFAFSSLEPHALLLAESEGSFDMDEYEDVHADALTRCCAKSATETRHVGMDEDRGSEDEGGVGLEPSPGPGAVREMDERAPISELTFLERTVAKHVRDSKRWKAGVEGQRGGV